MMISFLQLFYSHRHRRTEKEEDEELLEDSKHAQTHIIQFQNSPTCKLLSVFVCFAFLLYF